MKIIDINGNLIKETSQSRLQRFLYNRMFGRMILRVLITKPVSFLMGLFMNSFLSKIFIKPFIRKNKIDISKCEKQKFKSYNDFFTRKLKHVVYDKDEHSFISPCDAKLSVYPIALDTTYLIKGSTYSLNSLLKDDKLAKEYLGGYLLVFRLEVDDYHRYMYTDTGKILSSRKIKGKFHTVNPIAFEKYDVFKENSREYAVLETKHFGNLIQVEVGALMVGKIKNHPVTEFSRGDERGLFLFGGSTVIQIIKKDTVRLNKIYLEHTLNNCETIVSIGEKIGEKIC